MDPLIFDNIATERMDMVNGTVIPSGHKDTTKTYQRPPKNIILKGANQLLDEKAHARSK